MYRTALALTSAALMLMATTAAAQETEPPPGPPPINACGTTPLMVEEVKVNINQRENETGFGASGVFVLRISDEDSSVVVRQSGSFSVKLTESGATVTNNGRTLLIPNDPALAEAIEEAGLPELPLIIGRVVIEDGPNGPEIVSVKGRVIDVCELLAR